MMSFGALTFVRLSEDPFNSLPTNINGWFHHFSLAWSNNRNQPTNHQNYVCPSPSRGRRSRCHAPAGVSLPMPLPLQCHRSRYLLAFYTFLRTKNVFLTYKIEFHCSGDQFVLMSALPKNIRVGWKCLTVAYTHKAINLCPLLFYCIIKLYGLIVVAN